MLFNSMFTKRTSNCLEASRTAFSGAVPASERRRSRLRGSSASEAGLYVISDDLELGSQRAGGFHRLQDRKQILWRCADRIKRFHNVVQVRTAHYRERAFFLP